MEIPTIPEYYAGQKILITGATGFMGKVLVEKIIRCCPDVDSLYLIIREKRGKTPQERWDEITEKAAFDLIRKECPERLKKVQAISGDIMQKNLGLSESDRELLINNVTLIFHSAASVLFFENVHQIILMNVYSTYGMVELARKMKNLKCFLHVSTAYSNSDKDIPIEEKIYPAQYSWRDVLAVTENETPYTLGCLTNKILGKHPNVYTLTKSLAEQIIQEYSQYFPAIVIRPSVVVSAIKEPCPGWCDSWNGPALIGVLCGTGIVRVFFGKPDGYMDYVAVDYAINGLLVSVWDAGVRNKTGITVYSCSFGSKMTMSNDEFRKMGMVLAKEDPFQDMVWRPGGFPTSNRAVFYAAFYILQLIPAGIISLLHLASGQEPRLWKIMKKYIVAINAVSFFSLRTYDFPNKGYRSLQEKVLPEDRLRFSVDHDDSLTPQEGFRICGKGIKKFMLNETEETLPQRLKKYKTLYWVDMAAKTVLGFIAFIVASRMLSRATDYIFS